MNEQRRTKSLFNSGERLLLFILLLSFMDFGLYSLHLMVIGFFVWGLLRGQISVPKGVFPPLAFTITIVIFWQAKFLSPTTWMKCLVWPFAFLLGYGIVQPTQGDCAPVSTTEKKAQLCFLIAALGFFIHLLLNMYINRGQEMETRNTIDFWSRQQRAATGQGGIMTVPLAWCIANIMQERNFKKRLLAILAVLLMVYYNLTLGTRSVIFVLGILAFVAVFFSMRAGRTSQRKYNIMLAVFGCAIILFFLYQYNVWNLRVLISESVLGERFLNSGVSIKGDSRWTAKVKYLKYMPQYLFGGKNILRRVHIYAHDVFLDTYDEAGIFAFFAVIAMVWDGIAKLQKCLKAPSITFNTKILVLCAYVAIFCVFMIEPIFAGMPWLLMTFCFFQGIVTCLVAAAQAEKIQKTASN